VGAISNRWSSTDFKQAVINLPETNESNLKNGFRVASEDSGGATCTVNILILLVLFLLSKLNFLYNDMLQTLFRPLILKTIQYFFR